MKKLILSFLVCLFSLSLFAQPFGFKKTEEPYGGTTGPRIEVTWKSVNSSTKECTLMCVFYLPRFLDGTGEILINTQVKPEISFDGTNFNYTTYYGGYRYGYYYQQHNLYYADRFVFLAKANTPENYGEDFRCPISIIFKGIEYNYTLTFHRRPELQ